MFNKILVPIDGSEQSEKAEKMAIDIAKMTNAEIKFIHVFFPPDRYLAFFGEAPISVSQEILDELEHSGERLLEKHVTKYKNEKLKIESELLMGNIADLICQEAKAGNFDLIIIGSRGLGAIKGYLLGSVSTKVSQHAPCPVLITH